MSLSLALERSVAPLDRLRSACFRQLCRSAWTRALLTRREQRFAFLLLLHAPVAATLALLFPVHLFVLGPLLLGVPHVAADVRYLVLRQPLSPRWRTLLWLSMSSLLVAAACGLWFGARSVQRIELALGAVTVALAAVSASNGQPRSRRSMLCLGAAVTGGVAGMLAPQLVRIALLHAHNLVAVALLFMLFPARVRATKLPWLVVAGAVLALASGVFYKVTLASWGHVGFGAHVFELADWVAPGLRADLALGVCCAFVYLQSVHYLSWLALIPQRSQRGEGTLAFGMSVRSLLRDFGAKGAGLVVLLTLALPTAALFGAWRAQRAYLSLANFHAYLELASLSYFWIRRQPR